VIDRYLDELASDLSDELPAMLVMQANGGVVSAARARRRPAHLIESGPAAGVLAAAALARESGIANAVALDMGRQDGEGVPH
jgi:N-methylhydantoinase A